MRALAEFSLETGDLYMQGDMLDRMREGTQGHKSRQSEYTPDYRSEVPIEITVPTHNTSLTIGGRADGLLLTESTLLVEEIKTTRDMSSVSEGKPVHWAQAEGYAHMLCVRENRASCIVRLVYIEAHRHRNSITLERHLDAAELSRRFERLLEPYARWLDALTEWQQRRDGTLRTLRFPYGGYRDGQRKLAGCAFVAMRDAKRLMVEAPTGIGKTVAALFPALKAMGEGHVERLFYLTARRTARYAARDCVELMRPQGLKLRYVMLMAKEQICPDKAMSCSPEHCARCVGYYDRHRAALTQALTMERFDAEAVRALADAHTLCPFELELELCEQADLIICDYNYVFDPRVYLRRFFTNKGPYGLLIDEAHNLDSRARDMLSATLRYREFYELRRGIGGALGRDSAEYRLLTRLLSEWKGAVEAVTLPSHSPAKPENLIAAALEFASGTEPSIPLPDDALGQRWADCFFAAYDFARVGQEFAPETYRAIYEQAGKGCDVTLLCCDPQPHIRSCLAKVRSAVLFSATLTPWQYYFERLGLSAEAGDAFLKLASPFPRENLFVAQLPVATRYRMRSESLPAVVDAIAALAQSNPGNYMACFPSHAYLNAAADMFAARCPHVTLIRQTGGMDDAAREQFLRCFQPEPTRSMVAFIAMGGIFAEGIDLPGDLLSGAVIVGIALPQLCIEREALAAFFAEKFDPTTGYQYAYTYPGICKILQSAGRVIRTPADRGAVLLLDDRYMRSPYTELLPWSAEHVPPEELQRVLRRFFEG